MSVKRKSKCGTGLRDRASAPTLALVLAGSALVIACATGGQQPPSSPPSPASWASGISTKEETGRAFDAVSGIFVGLDDQGALRVTTSEGDVVVRLTQPGEFRRGSAVISAVDLRQGETVDAVGELREGVLHAESVAIAARFVDGTVVGVQDDRIEVANFYDNGETDLYVIAGTQVVDSTGHVRIWEPGAVRSGMQIHAIGYLDPAGSFLADTIWLGE